MNISLTGTFSVPRKGLEQLLIEAGHAICSLGRKTEILLVGGKTASASKVAETKGAEIFIIKETAPDKILAAIQAAGKVFYARFYGSPKGLVKIIATSEKKAMEKIFKKFPQYAETEGEDIEFLLSEEEFITEGNTAEEATIFIE